MGEPLSGQYAAQLSRRLRWHRGVKPSTRDARSSTEFLATERFCLEEMEASVSLE
jgi:hypothetical protein